MSRPSLGFLCDCIVAALLDRYQVTRPPVPMREILDSPPPDLARDLSLTESLPFGDALWMRLASGQGAVFVNPAISEAQRRYGMARAMYLGLCTSRGGRAAGLPQVPNTELSSQMDLFARRLLLAPALLPPNWQAMPPESLADLCGVPLPVAEAHLHEAAPPATPPSPATAPLPADTLAGAAGS
jgi:hypothetical protein